MWDVKHLLKPTLFYRFVALIKLLYKFWFKNLQLRNQNKKMKLILSTSLVLINLIFQVMAMPQERQILVF